MNKKLIVGSLIASLVFSLTLATSVSAFWPFDSLFKKSGDVKAETTEKKMMVGDVGPGGSRAFMTYQTLVSMNDTCRRMFAQEYPTPTKARITPSTRRDANTANEKKMAADSAESRESMYALEFGIESKNEKDLSAIYNNLKARCDNIANLTTRMQRIYKGNVKPTAVPTKEISVTSSPKMKCDLSSRVSNHGCPANMICNEGYCQPAREIPTTGPTLSIDMPCGGIRGLICPDGYSCSYKTDSNKWGKVSPDAMGTCVKGEVRAY